MKKDPFDAETELRRDLFNKEGIVVRRLPKARWQSNEGEQQLEIAQRATLGSSPEVDIRFQDATVSRLHAALELREDGLWVVDLGSRNGTYLDGIKVRQARVPDGAQIDAGESRVEVRYAKAPTQLGVWPEESYDQLIGKSLCMRQLFFEMDRIATLDGPVIVHGETGTGKELVARALHNQSPRSASPFAVVDCAALPDTLLEAELFGYAQGAFTGATQDRMGQVAYAEGGTLFLDEIGELPEAMQPKLLRLLESRTYRPLGTNDDVSANVRFVAATHRNLAEMVNRGTFREDLYFRLSVFSLEVPSLEERPEDIPLLAQRFAPDGADPISASLLRKLRKRAWPGNIRELRNVVRRALALGEDTIGGQDAANTSATGGYAPELLKMPYSEARDAALDQFEHVYLTQLLSDHGGNVSRAAAATGLNRTYLHKLLSKHGLR